MSQNSFPCMFHQMSTRKVLVGDFEGGSKAEVILLLPHITAYLLAHLIDRPVTPPLFSVLSLQQSQLLGQGFAFSSTIKRLGLHGRPTLSGQRQQELIRISVKTHGLVLVLPIVCSEFPAYSYFPELYVHLSFPNIVPYDFKFHHQL